MGTPGAQDYELELSARKQANVPQSLHKLFRERWSPRAFSDRPVSSGDLQLIFEAARWAASSSNEQPWRFIVARSFDTELHGKLAGVLNSFNQQWANSAPVLILTVAKRDFSNGTPNRHALHDTGAALAHMMLEATALGLHAHAMAGFDMDKARQVFGIPDGYEPAAAVAIGFLGSPDSLPERYRERELAPRERKPLSDLMFGAEWGEPLQL